MAYQIDGVSGRRIPIPAALTGRRIRGGSGLGDSIYVRPIAEHFLRLGEEVTVRTNYPEIFLGTAAKIEPFGRDRINVLAHYTGGKMNSQTNQWQDICASAGVRVPLAFSWETRNAALVARLREKARGRKLVLVHGGRSPMGRADRFGIELLPDRGAFKTLAESLDGCFRVGIGRGEIIYPLPVDLDLNGRTSVADLLDLASACDGVVAQCSFAIPLAEVFDRPLLVLWSAYGLASRENYIRTITPAKILSKPTSRAVMDSAAPEALQEAAHAFRDL